MSSGDDRYRVERAADAVGDGPKPGDFDYFRPVTPYIVLRAALGLPWEFMPEGMEGRWIDRPAKSLLPLPPGQHAMAVGTGRYERRDDGMLAEVFEVRPADQSDG